MKVLLGHAREQLFQRGAHGLDRAHDQGAFSTATSTGLSCVTWSFAAQAPGMRTARLLPHFQMRVLMQTLSVLGELVSVHHAQAVGLSRNRGCAAASSSRPSSNSTWAVCSLTTPNLWLEC